MFYTNHREHFREAFYTAWEKYLQGHALIGIEKQIVAVILFHPEYQPLFNQRNHPSETALNLNEFEWNENPFLHLSLHLAIRDQIDLNRPQGISEIQKKLSEKYSDPHEVEHLMMNCLREVILNAQKIGCMPSDEEYIDRLKSI